MLLELVDKFDLATVIIAAMLAYAVGRAISFREAKQKAYAELLPPILKLAYRKVWKGDAELDERRRHETELCKALIKLWLYGSKNVAKAMDHAVYILQDRNERNKTPHNITKALQNAIAKMRADIQILPWQKLKPEEIEHIYTWLEEKRKNVE